MRASMPYHLLIRFDLGRHYCQLQRRYCHLLDRSTLEPLLIVEVKLSTRHAARLHEMDSPIAQAFQAVLKLLPANRFLVEPIYHVVDLCVAVHFELMSWEYY
eukprot:scaffold40358_cov176-Amphora_coffeaeformis.AAC.3